MRSIRLLLTGLVLLVALVADPAYAADFRQGGAVTVDAGQTVNDDLYTFGGSLDIGGTVNGDVVASGGAVTIGGRVTGDLIVAGGTITVSGQIDGSVRAAGGTITINGPVQQDVVLAGGTLTTGQGARIGRDLVLGAGSSTVNGPVGRAVRVASGDLTLNAPVAGSVNADVDRLRLGSGAIIGGDLRYESERAAEIAPGGRVVGRTVRTQPDASGATGDVAGSVLGWFRNLVGLFLLGLLWVLPFPRYSRQTADTLTRRPLVSLGVGFAALIAIPIVAVLVFIAGLFIGGWWLALMALAVYAILLTLSLVATALAVGVWIAGRGYRRRPVPVLLGLLLGLVLLQLVGVVPYVGGIVAFVALLFGLGSLVLTGIRLRREPSAAIG